ncbi:hypothetical protein TSUD_334460 [Trifolium subterraneum]|uniref:Uncharacterized protein n=1 Tax=Trifolium subterraneum TaxID=3900 RepID=A0A2Z6LYL6_TRISU|nr:hypothetical protein TSUD_334460 [Trifolium subterraneum]
MVFVSCLSHFLLLRHKCEGDGRAAAILGPGLAESMSSWPLTFSGLVWVLVGFGLVVWFVVCWWFLVAYCWCCVGGFGGFGCADGLSLSRFGSCTTPRGCRFCYDVALVIFVCVCGFGVATTVVFVAFLRRF